MEIEVKVFIYQKPYKEFVKDKEVIATTHVGKYIIVLYKKAV